jgi:hypothetical protein
MARTAKITFSLSTDSRVAHIGPWFADFRVNGRQNTRVGTEEMMRSYLKEVKAACNAHGVELTVNNDTLGELNLG